VIAINAVAARWDGVEQITADGTLTFQPDGFNRHATQHGERNFFSKANALAGLLLLVGWLREFKWLEANHPQVFADREDRAE
jgi:hypothetical protein